MLSVRCCLPFSKEPRTRCKGFQQPQALRVFFGMEKHRIIPDASSHAWMCPFNVFGSCNFRQILNWINRLCILRPLEYHVYIQLLHQRAMWISCEFVNQHNQKGGMQSVNQLFRTLQGHFLQLVGQRLWEEWAVAVGLMSSSQPGNSYRNFLAIDWLLTTGLQMLQLHFEMFIVYYLLYICKRKIYIYYIYICNTYWLHID